MRWNYTPVDADRVAALARNLGTGSVVAELLIRNGLDEAEAATRFLQPTLATLGDPFLLANLATAADRLLRAMQADEDVVILGDYDVDGVSSTTFLVSILRRLGLSPRYFVPRRLEEGYGLTRNAIDRALEGGRPGLFIALDCGTNSTDEIAYLRSLGVDVIVVDHHRSKEPPRLEAILVNPHVHESADDAAWRNLCTVGLVFKLVHGVLKRLRDAQQPLGFEIKLKDYLDLVALGTIADLVPLTGENRILAKHGLRMLAETRRPGLLELMKVAGLKADQGLAPVDISFRLGPRINASGRLADAALSVDLLLSDDWAFCRKAAQQLETLNRERQDIEREITEQAEAQVEERYSTAHGLVLFDEGWHPGVVGIVAGRISRKYNRPTIVLGNEGDFAKGSGRSLVGFNLVETLAACQECLESWGGHPMAVGIAMKKVRLEDFRQRFDAAIFAAQDGGAVEPGLALTCWLDGTQVTEELLGKLEMMHPFGQGNPEPTFGVRGLRVRQMDVFKEVHFRFTAEDAKGRRLSGVAWKQAGHAPPTGRPLELAVQINWNHFNGRKSMQLELLDWRDPPGENSA